LFEGGGHAAQAQFVELLDQGLGQHRCAPVGGWKSLEILLAAPVLVLEGKALLLGCLDGLGGNQRTQRPVAVHLEFQRAPGRGFQRLGREIART
jgi:hypothetical protein